MIGPQPQSPALMAQGWKHSQLSFLFSAFSLVKSGTPVLTRSELLFSSSLQSKSLVRGSESYPTRARHNIPDFEYSHLCSLTMLSFSFAILSLAALVSAQTRNAISDAEPARLVGSRHHRDEV